MIECLNHGISVGSYIVKLDIRFLSKLPKICSGKGPQQQGQPQKRFISLRLIIRFV